MTYCKLVSGQSDTSTTFTILEIGLPQSNDYLVARSTISKKWGIQYKRVADCVVTEELVDSVKKHNETTYADIAGKYGSNWNSQYKKEIEAELEIQRKIRHLIDIQDYIRERDSLTRQIDGNGLDYIIYPTENTSIYTAVVTGLGKWNDTWDIVIYYRLTIDLKKETVKIESDQTELMRGKL